MFKSQKQFKIISFYLIILLELLFITNNYYVMAMNNGHVSQNNGHDNNHANFELQAKILQDLNSEQARLTQRIMDACNNNVSFEVINNLMSQNVELSSRITSQQIILHNAMPQQNNRNQTNNTRRL